MDRQLFTRCTHFPVVICRKCQHAVDPSQVQTHLRGPRHGLRKATPRQIQEAIQQWEGIEPATELVIPLVLPSPIPELPVHHDGLLCRRDPIRCQFVAGTLKSIEQHWREEHAWRTQVRGGHPTKQQQSRTEEEKKRSYHQVSYQRLFIQGPNSHYIHLRFPTPETASASAPMDYKEQIGQLVQQVEDNFHEQQQQANIIRVGERDEANPWLRRTQWSYYLDRIDPAQLIACLAEPEEESQDRTETAARAIWQAMEGLIRFSQATVSRLGHILRTEAIKTEKHQNRHQPLQAYMDHESIVKHMRPWQQILMFFARTQVEHDWESPGYRLTPRQRKTWRVVWRFAQESYPVDRSGGGSPSPAIEADDIDRASETHPKTRRSLNGIQQACLDFCIELLNQSIQVHEYDSAMVCAMAVLGRREDGWRSPEDYPPILSRVIKIARFMVVLKAMRLDPNAGEWDVPLDQRRKRQIQVLPVSSPMEVEEYIYTGSQDSGYETKSDGAMPTPEPPSSPPTSSPRSSDGGPAIMNIRQVQSSTKHGRSFREWLELLMNAFMVRGTHSPMQWLLDLRTYGLKIHYNSTTPGHIGWYGKDELLYQQFQFTMGDFRGFVHGLVSTTRRLLREELLFGGQSSGTVIPSIPWASMRDDPTQGKAGWSFLHDRRTRWSVQGSRWLIDRVRDEPFMQRRFIRTTGSSARWHVPSVDAYLQRVVEFREKLAICVHITAGQPARVPELLSIRHQNTEVGGHRNIFIEDGMVVFVTRYHKGYTLSGDIKVIHRYVPREVGELAIWYLWLVLPFAQRLEAFRQRQCQGTEEMPTNEQRERRAYLWSPDPNGRAWTSERFREVFKRESRIGLKGQALNIAAYRNVAIGISRRFMRPSSMFPQDTQASEHEESTMDHDDELGDDPETWLGQIADFQAGHTPHVAGMIYARDVIESSGVIAERRQKFRVSSTDWHRFLGFPTAFDPNRSPSDPMNRKRKRAPFEVEVEEGRMERRFRLCQVDMEEALQRMMGDESIQFRGNQQAAIRAIQAGDSPVVAVMPTGGGKSMLFMLPAWVEPGGTTVVVVPLVALRGDLQRRCSELGISCVEWVSRRPPDEASIVLVTPESALSEDFITFLNRQRLLCRLDRIVIDECHIVLNNQTDFRPQIQQLGKLVAAETQIVLLTATLPPSEEVELFNRIRFPPSSVQMFRARTSRGNVAYRVVQPPLDRPYQHPHRWVKAPNIVAWIQQRIRQYQRSGSGKVIIYAPTVVQVKAIAMELGCEAYYHEAIGKDGMLERFRQGQQPVIVATGALGMGIDMPDIRCIIHLGRPRTLLDYGQESGRAGRDGQASEAIMIIPSPEPAVPWDSDKGQSLVEQSLVHEYVERPEGACCRRIILDGYLDGVVDGYIRQHCDEGEVRCDGCDPEWEVREPAMSPSPSPILDEGYSGRESIDIDNPRGHDSPATHFPDASRDSDGTCEGVVYEDEIHELQRQYPEQFHDHISRDSSEEREEQRMREVYPEEFNIPSSSTDGSNQSVSPDRSISEARSDNSDGSVSPVRSDRSEGIDSFISPYRPVHQSASSNPEADNGRSPIVPHSAQRRFQEQDIHRAQLSRDFYQQQQEEERQQELLREGLQQWYGRCFICFQYGEVDDGHSLAACPREEGQVAQDWRNRVEERIQWARYSYCFGCRAPQWICDQWEHVGRGSFRRVVGRRCQYPDTLVPMVAAMLHGPGRASVQVAWQHWLGGFRVDGSDLKQVSGFLGQKVKVGIFDQSQMAMAFCWLYRLWKGRGDSSG